jgi:hypothetical protein
VPFVDKKTSTMIYELRTYWAAPGRLDDVHARFRNHSCRILAKHGMPVFGFWEPSPRTPESGDMVYILIHPDEAAMQANWAAFRADPEWLEVRAASEVNGKIVERTASQVLKPTDYSPVQ